MNNGEYGYGTISLDGYNNNAYCVYSITVGADQVANINTAF